MPDECVDALREEFGTESTTSAGVKVTTTRRTQKTTKPSTRRTQKTTKPSTRRTQRTTKSSTRRTQKATRATTKKTTTPEYEDETETTTETETDLPTTSDYVDETEPTKETDSAGKISEVLVSLGTQSNFFSIELYQHHKYTKYVVE